MFVRRIVDQRTLLGWPQSFFDDILRDSTIETELGVHVLQLAILLFKLLRSLDLGNLRISVLGSPVVQRGVADAVPTETVFDRFASFNLVQNADDLCHCESRLAHRNSSSAGFLTGGTKLCAVLLRGMITQFLRECGSRY